MSTNILNASVKGNVKAVRNFLNNGANINQVDNDGNTPLYIASEKGQVEMVKLLLKKGAEVNKADKFEITPLNRASFKGHDKVVKLLLMAPGIKVNQEDESGGTPLDSASHWGHLEVVKLLLRVPGINVNPVDKHGHTPLWKTSCMGHLEVVKLLLKAGADPFKKDEYGETALDVAKNDTIKKLLREAMGIATPWRNMNANQRKMFKPILIKRMVAKNYSNKKFPDPVSKINYSLKTLKPVNKDDNRLGGLGLVIDNGNNPIRFVNATVLRNAINRSQTNTVRGVFHNNWSLINVTPKEYFDARKGMEKLSAMAKGKRTRKNLETGRTNRIEGNMKKTNEIAKLRTIIRSAKIAKKRLNNLM